MFFSATYEQDVMDFAEVIVPNPLIIRLLREQESLDNIKQYYVKCKSIQDKYVAVTNIYGVISIGQAIIFCHVSFIKIQTYSLVSNITKMLFAFRLEEQLPGFQKK